MKKFKIVSSNDSDHFEHLLFHWSNNGWNLIEYSYSDDLFTALLEKQQKTKYKGRFAFWKWLFAFSCILISFNSFSQTAFNQTTNIELHDNRGEVYPLIAEGYMYSLFTYAPAYEILMQATDIDQAYCQIWASFASILSGWAVNELKGGSNKDLGFRLAGAGLGAFTVTITIGNDSKRDKQRQILKYGK